MSGTVILGATGAVGSCLARRLISSGERIFIAGRDAVRLGSLANELHCGAALIETNDPQSILDCFQEASGQLGSITGTAHCVGSLLLKPAHSTTLGEFSETLQTNLGSAFATVKAATLALRVEGGSIVLISSAAAGIGMANHEAISAAKAGVEGLVRSAAATYAPRRIRINAVAPGLTKSNMTRHLWQNEQQAASAEHLHALGRLGEPDDIASMIQWLLTEDNNWITGQVFGVDGGLSSVLVRPKFRM